MSGKPTRKVTKAGKRPHSAIESRLNDSASARAGVNRVIKAMNRKGRYIRRNFIQAAKVRIFFCLHRDNYPLKLLSLQY